MAKPEWGLKRTCQSCGVRFYDLRRDPIVCPACQAVFDPDRVPRPRRIGPVVKDEPVAAGDFSDDETADTEEEGAETSGREAEVAEADDDSEEGGAAIEELASEDGELMEDTSELGEDDDDIGEVMEHLDDEADEKP